MNNLSKPKPKNEDPDIKPEIVAPNQQKCRNDN